MRMTGRGETAVLVVDDDAWVRDLVATVLLDEGYRVYTAANGRAALAALATEHPDIVLMDVNMPHLDGLSACRILRDDRDDRTANLPVVIMSARPIGATQLHACRADRFLPKPFDIDVLLDEVASCLRTPALSPSPCAAKSA